MPNGKYNWHENTLMHYVWKRKLQAIEIRKLLDATEPEGEARAGRRGTFGELALFITALKALILFYLIILNNGKMRIN